jgi:MFS family permease
MAATMLLFFSFQALFPVLPLYITAIGGSPADNGLATWVFALAALLTRPLAGALADRWGRKPVLVVGAVLFGSGPPLYALVSNMPLLLGARVAHGVGMALFSTAYQAFVADLLAPDRYGEGLGLANIASMVTMAAGPLFGEWAARGFGFGVLFMLLGAVGGVGLLATLVLPGRVRGGHGFTSLQLSGQSGLRQALRQSGVRAGALGMALLGVPFGAFIVFLPLLADARGLGGTGWVFAAYALASSLMLPAAGRIADRWGGGRTALVGLALVGVTAAGLAGVASSWSLLGLAGLLGAGHGVAQAGLGACVQGSVGHALRGSAAAIQYTAFDLLVGLGSLGLGLLASATDYCVMYAAVSGITLLGLVVVVGWLVG